MSTANIPTSQERAAGTSLSLATIAQRGVLAVVGAIVANLLARAILVPLLGVSPDFPPFQMGAITFFTTLGSVAAVLVFAATVRLARNPMSTFRRIAAVVLVLSVIPNVLLAINPPAAPVPGNSSLNMLALIIPHIVAAAVIVGVLTGNPTERA